MLNSIRGYRTILAAATLSVSAYWQSDAVVEWIKQQPFGVAFGLFAFITLLRVITTTPMFEGE